MSIVPGLRLSSRTLQRAINRCNGDLKIQQRAISSIIATSSRPPRIPILASRIGSSSILAQASRNPRRSFHPSPAAFARQRRPVLTKGQRRIRRLRNLLVFLAFLSILYYTYSPFRHTVIASVRCARLMKAVALDVLDYKQVFRKEEAMGELHTLTDEQREIRSQARRDCHTRSAKRMLEALKKNSGIYVKLGQHVAAVQLLPKEWTGTMAPLQDQCFPSPMNEINDMLLEDMAMGIDQLFKDFSPNPIGVASLAQVHRAYDRRTKRAVAVKIQHPDLQEFARVDMLTVNFAISAVKYFFPDFEFSWLGEEMNEMLPLEMDFRHEAANAKRTKEEFAHLEGKTSLYVPEVLWADRRCMVMEYIEGARVDDLVYLRDNGIDRNQVSQELSRIFSQMVYLNGRFHADPHHGNLLIRKKAPTSKSPFNFDVCLLDHGQYFDIPDDLRVNYAHFWLSLIRQNSPQTTIERKKWAKAVGNVDDEMYPILESAITGQMNMADAGSAGGPTSLLESGSDDHIRQLRNAMMEREGLVLSIFELLRTVPRRLLMILKLSDLQRSLDQSLHTTHGQSRIFVIVARYCAKAVWDADYTSFRSDLSTRGLSFRLFSNFITSWWNYAYWTTTLRIAEMGMDTKARLIKVGLWVQGLSSGGFALASQKMAGLS